MAANDVTKGEHVDDEEKGSEHRALGDTMREGGSA